MKVEKNNTGSTYCINDLELNDMIELSIALDSCCLQQKTYFYNIKSAINKIISMETQPKKLLSKHE